MPTEDPLPYPVVDAVGRLHLPPGWRGGQAPPSRRRRVLALVLAAVFALLTLASSAISLGAYCSTSDGPDTRHLPAAAPARSPGTASRAR